jgi:hypothetical protein
VTRAAWWLASWVIPIGAAWPLWHVSHGVSLAVVVIATVIILGMRPGGRRG